MRVRLQRFLELFNGRLGRWPVLLSSFGGAFHVREWALPSLLPGYFVISGCCLWFGRMAALCRGHWFEGVAWLAAPGLFFGSGLVALPLLGFIRFFDLSQISWWSFGFAR
jgi:hypothetical protein